MSRSKTSLASATIALALTGLTACTNLSGGRGEAMELAAQKTVLHEQSGPALRLARAARDAGDFVSAVNLYRGVVAARPDDANVTVEFADALRDGGSFDEAIDVYNRVTVASPARVGALLGLTHVHLLLAEPIQALEYAEMAKALVPANVPVLIAYGVALDVLDRHLEAQTSYRTALALSPRDVAARNDLALSLALNKQYAEAIEILTPMSKSVTATPRIRQNLALVYGLMGDDVRAADFSRTDLDAATTDGNLRFFDFVRNESK